MIGRRSVVKGTPVSLWLDNNMTIEKAERDKSWNRCINEQQLSHMKYNKTQTCRHWRWKRPVRSSSPSFCQFRIVPWSDVLNFKGKKNKNKKNKAAKSFVKPVTLAPEEANEKPKSHEQASSHGRLTVPGKLDYIPIYLPNPGEEKRGGFPKSTALSV